MLPEEFMIIGRRRAPAVHGGARMSTDPAVPDVPVWQRSFLPEDRSATPPAAPAYPPPVAASPVTALPPPTGPAYGTPG